MDSIIWTGALTAGLYSEMISDQSWGETVLHMPDSISVISDVMKTVSSLRRKLAQGTKQAVHLFSSVVMYQTDAQHSAFLFHLKTLR